MPKVFKLSIRNFRTFSKFVWKPSLGMNCLVGAGDSGKSTVLDAIDYCLGARRSVQFCDYDFHNSDTDQPIKINILLGSLEPSLLSMDAYGDFFHGYNLEADKLEVEPGHGLETTLVLQLKVEKDLEPQWSLLSNRADNKELHRNLRWEDRQNSAPLRLGDHGDWHLTWRRGALFEKLTEEKLALTVGLSDAAREARANFGSSANSELKKTLETVKNSAEELGVPTGGVVNALLDANSVKFGTGAIALHDANNIPLSSLGTGSKRLLIAGLARKVAKSANISLVDEIETGLEPHRIRNLLNTLGAKDTEPLQQVFATTHSPVVLRELAHSQLTLLRTDKKTGDSEPIVALASAQRFLRSTPEAFLGKRILICEGKSEMGFLRGFDQNPYTDHCVSMETLGTVLVDGGGADSVLPPANEFLRLGYEVAIFMDSDKPLNEDDEHEFVTNGGTVFRWPNKWALEDAIFQCVSGIEILSLLDYATSLPQGHKVDDQIKTASSNKFDLANARGWAADNQLPPGSSTILGAAARNKKTGWFKSISRYEHIAKNILSPNWSLEPTPLTEVTTAVLNWAWGKNAQP